VDLDQIGVTNCREWIGGIFKALRDVCGAEVAAACALRKVVKAWFVLVASTKRSVDRVPTEFLKVLHEETERYELFAHEDLDRVQIHVVPDGKEAADHALARLIHSDGPSTHKIIVTGDKKLVTNLIWTKDLCRQSLVLVTTEAVRVYLGAEWKDVPIVTVA
jgi:hypothetical protein